MSIRILLMDDLDDPRNDVHQGLEKALESKGAVTDYVQGVGGKKDGMLESQVYADLKTYPNSPIDLIVADRDLSSYAEGLRGLSEATVRRAADALGIPVCGYARGEKGGDEYSQHGKEREACIRLSLSPGIEEFSQRVISIASGFVAIKAALPEGHKKAGERSSPGKLLATILGKPQYADKISLYASGDQNRLASILRLRGMESGKQLDEVACFLGYWLWDSVLRFPGITVGVIPAGSYLNISEEEFEKDEIQSLFSKALYTGPFSGAKVRMWWRPMLDDIVAESNFSDGRTYASDLLKREIPASQCVEETSVSAGYYCMLKKKPVSVKYSQGGLPWFPRGADLARVSISAMAELGPWL